MAYRKTSTLTERLGSNYIGVAPSHNIVSLISEIRDQRVRIDLVGEDTSQNKGNKGIPNCRARRT